MNDKGIPERTESSINGLRKMCEYILERGNTQNMNIVEIGAWTGISACVFSSYFNRVVSIDAWEQSILEKGLALYDIREVEKLYDVRIIDKKNIIKMKLKSLDAAKTLQLNNVDCVYIDGAHDYENVKADILAWLPKVKKGGFICGHDFHAKKFPGVIRAVRETIGVDSNLVTFSDTSWLKRKV